MSETCKCSQISTSDRTHARTGPETPRAEVQSHTQNSNTRTHTRQTDLTLTHTDTYLAIRGRSIIYLTSIFQQRIQKKCEDDSSSDAPHTVRRTGFVPHVRPSRRTDFWWCALSRRRVARSLPRPSVAPRRSRLAASASSPSSRSGRSVVVGIGDCSLSLPWLRLFVVYCC